MVRVSGAPARLVRDLKEQLEAANPAVLRAQRFVGWVSNDIPRTIHAWDEDMATGDLLIPPGHLYHAWQHVKAAGCNVLLEDEAWFEATTVAPRGPSYSGELRPYQSRIVEASQTRRAGYFISPCGSGKTDTLLRIAAGSGYPTLVIVHTSELMEQWVERARERLGVEATTIGGKKKSRAAAEDWLIVGMVQTLVRAPGALAMLSRTRKTVIVDECDLCPAKTFTQVLRKLDPVWRWGATATEKRADGLHPMIGWWLGRKFGEVTQVELEEGGYVLRPDLHVITTQFEATYDPDVAGDLDRLEKARTADEDRNALIGRTIAQWHEPGRVHIVLVSQVEYAWSIAESMPAPMRAVVCNARLGVRARRDAWTSIKSGESNVMIATSLADRGLDLTFVTDVWFASSTGDPGRTRQRGGRACRPDKENPNKPKPRIHDFVDVRVSREKWSEYNQRMETHRIYVNQFRKRFHGYYKTDTNYNEADVRDVMAGRDL